MPEAEKKETFPLQMEILVYYYDSSWHLLYGQTGEVASFVPVRGKDMGIRSGQKVRLEGTVIPADGLDGNRIKATVLMDGLLPAPLPTAGRMEAVKELNGRLVEFEGYVVNQVEPDATHIEGQLLSENHAVNFTWLIEGTDPVPQLTGARLRIRGVYDALPDSDGRVRRILCWVAGRTQVEVRGWLAHDTRFKLPRTPIDRLEAAGQQPWVRIVGRAHEQEAGTSLTVRDDTGQVLIATPQPGALPSQATVEVIGRPVRQDMGWTLAESIFRRIPTTDVTDAPPLPAPDQAWSRLRMAEHVLQLPREHAEKGFPVTLRGVVTWANERAPFFYLQDATGGVKVRRNPGQEMALPLGTTATITGVTKWGGSLPEVEFLKADDPGAVALPPARKVSLEQVQTGAEEGRRVEMRGYVRQVTPENNWNRLDLTSSGGEFTAYLPREESANHFRGAMVRIQGVCVSLTGENQKLPGTLLWVPNRDGITVDEPGSIDPFLRPANSIATLQQSTAVQAPNMRVRVTGMALLHQSGRYLHLQDASGGLFVLTREIRPTPPGSWIDVVGIPGRAGNRMVLREAVWRKAPAGPLIEPRELADPARLDPALDSSLVRLRAVLRQVARDEAQFQLTLEANGRRFNATLPLAADWPPPEPGSELGLTGVYVLEFDEYRQPAGFRLELRSTADLALLNRPSWWNFRRMLYVAGALGLCTLLVFAWVMALRRRVKAQTEQIRRQLEKEARLQGELERTTRLESLGVLAGGIAHDFNNLLTAILGNLGLAAMDKRVMTAAGDCIADAEQGARRARDIAQQLLTFAKGGDPVRSAVSLPEVVSEAAGFARHGSKVRFEFDYPPDLPAADADAGQISRVVHNLVLNAVQAMPEGGMVSIGLRAMTLKRGEIGTLAAGDYIRMVVADTGPGIPAENLALIFDPYFSTKGKAENSGLGLATVHSIIIKHHGHIEVESRVGHGTTFRLWLPVARGHLSPAASDAARSSPTTPARILVMDDEEVVRRVAGRMLSLAGHETVFTNEGMEAVRAYVAAREAGRPFDLVIFDLTVPGGMGGKDALQELIKVDPLVRAVASSGYSSDPVMANPAAYGFRSALPKPYDIPDLIRAVGEARQP